MKYHLQGCSTNGLIRHSVDSLCWKKFDEFHLAFASEPHNVRLGLASDGFNPFNNMSISHSI